MLLDTIAVVVIPFIVQYSKKILDTRWAPLLAFILGIAFGVGEYFVSGGVIIDLIVKGVAIGGLSTGLYAVTKTTIAGK